MKYILILLFFISNIAFAATLSVNNVPKVNTGGTTPKLEDSALTEIAGNIGVNSLNPSSKVDVVGTVKATAFVGDGSGLTGISSGISGLTTNLITKANSASTIGNSSMIDDGTNIGIGSTATAALLSVSSTANQDLFVVQDNGAGDGSPFVINAAGNIGIGTTASSNLVNIGSTGQATFSTAGLLTITNNTASTQDLINASGSGLSTGNGIDISSSNSGQTAPLALFTQSGASFAGDLLTATMSGASATGKVVRFNDTSNDSTPFVIDTNGNVGIGTTTPTGIIDIRTATSSVTKKSAANQACNTTCNGTLCLHGQDSTSKDDVDCTDATADICFCMGL